MVLLALTSIVAVAQDQGGRDKGQNCGQAKRLYRQLWSSGVVTFIVNQQGRVYQKDLGPNPAQSAGDMVEYNPDPTWTLAKE